MSIVSRNGPRYQQISFESAGRHRHRYQPDVVGIRRRRIGALLDVQMCVFGRGVMREQLEVAFDQKAVTEADFTVHRLEQGL